MIDADGGTRTASINGAYVALVDALQSVADELPFPVSEILTDSVAAVSVGLVEGEIRLDLEYVEDRDAEVDFNVVMTGAGQTSRCKGRGRKRPSAGANSTRSSIAPRRGSRRSAGSSGRHWAVEGPTGRIRAGRVSDGPIAWRRYS